MDLFAEPWAPPSEFPSLSGRMVALDTETSDPEMDSLGPGWCFPSTRGGVVGFSVAVDGFKGYWPFGHLTSGNLDRDRCLGWLGDQLRDPSITWTFTNALYDLGWLRREGLSWPAGRVLDVQVMAPLLDEYRRSYSLDNLSKSYGRAGKVDLPVKGVDIWRTHPSVIGPYAETDAVETLEVAKLQLPQIEAEDLVAASRLEHDLLPVLHEMRWRGIRVNVDRAVRLRDQYGRRITELKKEIKWISGMDVDPWVTEQVAAALQNQGHTLPQTPNGAWSVTKSLLEELTKKGCEVARRVGEMRKFDKTKGTFIEGHILGHVRDGRVHPQFNSLRSEREDGSVFGTVSYRFSSDTPNLQQLPGRDGELTADVRGCFEPEEDDEWGSADYSQQEPRMALAYAHLARTKDGRRIPGAAEELRVLMTDPKWHFHKRAASILSFPVERVKPISLGRMYGAGDGRIAEQMGMPYETVVGRNGREYLRAGPEVKAMLQDYDRGLPWVKAAAERTEEVATERGFLRLLGGYRARFGKGKDFPHKAFNRLVQGGSAVQNKRAMLAAHRAGLRLLAPVHDENNISVRPGSRDAEHLTECMREAAPELPVRFDVGVKTGANWGECK